MVINMKSKKIYLLFVLSILLFSLVSADVGLGISPSKMRENLVAGSTFEYDIVVFNVGSDAMDIELVANGEISEFTTIEPKIQTIQPEPEPHEFPIKNGKVFHVVFDIPNSGKEKLYTGSFSAISRGSSDSQLGGNVAVVSKVEFNVIPPQSFLSKLSLSDYLISGIIILLVILFFLLKKIGIRINISRHKSRSKSRAKKKSIKRKKKK